ncbi:MAG: complex I NDUFA9 subunit family protein [Betaproteobacteria bacterium]
MKHQNILVVGGAGFVGRHLVAALAARGARLTVPTRRRESAKHLILLPTVDVVEVERLDARVLAGLAAGRDAVVNLAGVLHSPRALPGEEGPNHYGPAFAQAHVELAQAVIGACRAAGVKRLMHMSALGADPAAPSEYLRSKGIGEQSVLAADDLEVTVFRPSVIFGPEDRFLNLFARLAALFPVLALGSPDARFQPVYVGDVVRAFLAALDSSDAAGKCYDLCGPKEYTLHELIKLVCAITGRRRLVIGLPDGLSYLQAWAMELLPVQLLTRDNYQSMKVPSVCDCAFPFGIQPALVETVAPSWLAPAGPRERYPQLRWKAKR